MKKSIKRTAIALMLTVGLVTGTAIANVGTSTNQKYDGLVKSPKRILNGTEEQQITSIPPSVSWLFEVSFHSLIYETDKVSADGRLHDELWYDEPQHDEPQHDEPRHDGHARKYDGRWNVE